MPGSKPGERREAPPETLPPASPALGFDIAGGHIATELELRSDLVHSVP